MLEAAAKRASVCSDSAAVPPPKLETARLTDRHRVGSVPDWYGFTLSFQGVLLEGTEVAFIVLTFGSNQKGIPLAAVAAGIAALVVAAAGFAVRAPLARVPENALKVLVGVMLTGFGTFWAGEGAGARWPGADAALRVLLPAIAVLAMLLATALRRQHRRGSGELQRHPRPRRQAGDAPAARLRRLLLRAGDRRRLAARGGTGRGRGVTYGVHRTGAPSWWLLPMAVLVLLPFSVWRAGRHRI